MKKIMLLLPIIFLTSCSSKTNEALSSVMTELFAKCNEVGDTLTVEVRATVWNRGMVVTCVSVGDNPKAE